MKTNSIVLCAMAAALGCAMSVQGFAGETGDEAYDGQGIFRPALVQQSVPPTVPTSRWDAQEPVETPEQESALATSAAPCDTCAAPCDFGLQLVAGVEATFFFPQLSRTFLQTAFINGLGPVNIINDAALGSADGSLLVGPRLTLGLQGDCWGLVGRYWNGGNWANGFTPALPDASQSGIMLFDSFSPSPLVRI